MHLERLGQKKDERRRKRKHTIHQTCKSDSFKNSIWRSDSFKLDWFLKQTFSSHSCVERVLQSLAGVLRIRGGIELSNFLQPRVLAAKSLGLTLVLGASMPVGKDRACHEKEFGMSDMFSWCTSICENHVFSDKCFKAKHVSHSFCKCIARVKTGWPLSAPKEGPFVHIASCISAILLPLDNTWFEVTWGLSL